MSRHNLELKPNMTASEQWHASVCQFIRDAEALPTSIESELMIDPERLMVYRELFYNNFDGTLKNQFPVLSEILDGERWDQLIVGFLEQHDAHSPFLRDLGKEFLGFLSSIFDQTSADLSWNNLVYPSYLFALAHYEWIELDLATREIEAPMLDCLHQIAPLNISDSDSIDGNKFVFALSPLAECLVYEWPVQKIGASNPAMDKPENPTCLLAWRDLQHDVNFAEITPAMAEMIQLFKGKKSLSKLVEKMSAQLSLEETQVIAFVVPVLNELIEKRVIISA